MWRTRICATLFGILVATGGNSFGWSLLDEVTVIDPGLTAELVWEITDSDPLCRSGPQNLDKLACELITAEDFWIGVDAAGSRYGVITAIEPLGSFFDIYRRPVGTNFNNHIVRLTKNAEMVVGMPTKLFAAGRWEVDVPNGVMLIGLRGQCLTSACQVEGDVLDSARMMALQNKKHSDKLIQRGEEHRPHRDAVPSRLLQSNPPGLRTRGRAMLRTSASPGPETARDATSWISSLSTGSL